MIKVYITNKVKAPFRYKRLYKKIVSELTKEHNINGDTEVNLILTNNEGIKKISKKYKHINKPTDVLSFPNDYEKLKPLINYNMLGDIYISYEKVEEQSEKYGHSLKREWAYLFAHGLLHLIGFDHIIKGEEKIMNEHVNLLMEKMKVGR